MDAHDWDQRYRESGLLWTAGPSQQVEQHTADPAAPSTSLGATPSG